MKKIIFLFAVSGMNFYIISCTKSTTGYYSCSGTPAAEDSTSLKSYAQANGIIPTADTSGLYYQIVDTGGVGPNPIGKNKITVTYVAKFLTGQMFDSTISPVTFELDSLIKGWQYGLPKIRSGGEIKLLVPSALAFGCTGNSVVPPNTPLYFDVNLISIGF